MVCLGDFNLGGRWVPRGGASEELWCVDSNDLHDSDGIVVKDGGDVFGGELVGRVADQETRLPDSTVANDDASDSWSAMSALMASEMWLCHEASEAGTR